MVLLFFFPSKVNRLAKYQNFKDTISKLAVNLRPSLSQEKLSNRAFLSVETEIGKGFESFTDEFTSTKLVSKINTARH